MARSQDSGMPSPYSDEIAKKAADAVEQAKREREQKEGQK